MMTVLSGTWSVMGARNAIDWPILDRLDRGMGEDSIFSHKTPWRNRGLFSQEAGHMDFIVRKVLISSTPADSCIWREAAFYSAHFAFLTYWTNRDIDPADSEHLLLPGLPPLFFCHIFPDQLSIFKILEKNHSKCNHINSSAGSLDIDRRFREMISDTPRKCHLSRYQVASRMSELTGMAKTSSTVSFKEC